MMQEAQKNNHDLTTDRPRIESEVEIKLVLYGRHPNSPMSNKWVLDYSMNKTNKYHLECNFFAQPKGYLREVLDIMTAIEGGCSPEKLESANNGRSQRRNFIERVKDAWSELVR